MSFYFEFALFTGVFSSVPAFFLFLDGELIYDLFSSSSKFTTLLSIYLSYSSKLDSSISSRFYITL